MNTLNRPTLLLAAAVLVASGLGTAADVVEVDLNAAAREYCHLLAFPLGWQTEKSVVPPKFGLADDYEFRVPGLQGSKFLVRGVQDLVGKYYTANIYGADFSDPKAVARPATEEDWKTAIVVPWQHWATSDVGRFIKSLGFRFEKSGKNEDGWLLSPGRSVLVVESWSGTLTRCGGSDVPGGITPCIDLLGSRGMLFFDVYNAGTGRKVMTLTAKFRHILPDDDFLKAGWVTERYFIIPLDEKRERCLVCEFGRTK
jgi:hypothetical protein